MIQIKESIIRFIGDRLHLKVYKEKTVVSYINGVKYLGFSFYIHKVKCNLCVYPKAKAKMKTRLKEKTSRINGMCVENLNSRNMQEGGQVIITWLI